jgi:hypothetical protein
VMVAVERGVGHGRCQFVTARGKLSRRRACSDPLWLTARGARRWSLRKALSLRAGSYSVAAEVVDGSGTSATGRSRRFKVR